MSGFAFQVTCLRLVANEPLFGIYAVPLDWQVYGQNVRIVIVYMVFCFWTVSELRSSFVRTSLFFGCLLVSRKCSFILSATDLEISPMYTVVQS